MTTTTTEKAASSTCAAAALITAGCLSLADVASALEVDGPAAIGAHIGSNHPGTSHKNSQNPGGYVRWGDAAPGLLAGVQLGVYRNSYRTWTGYAGRHVLGGELIPGRLSASLMVGAAIGYPQSPVVPMVAGSLGLQITRDLSINVTAMPKPSPAMRVGVYHLSAEWRLQ